MRGLAIEEIDAVNGGWVKAIAFGLAWDAIKAGLEYFHQDNGGPSAADGAAGAGYIG